ncbi:MAG: TPM domain-containing protein [Lachnospiraceae bacterium]|nr:TPM domain-containing protein [Lachnospiraceae bacterium]
MRKLGKYLCMMLCLAFLLLPMNVQAEGNYIVLIEDDADLLTEEQEAQLKLLMQDITAYGNVAFKSVNVNYASTDSYAENFYYSNFGTRSGAVFIIDMDNRNIWIETDGAVQRRIDANYAEVITDNIYMYATDGDYYECAAQAYTQMYTLLEGGRIAQPMKYICNGLMAISLAMIINFLIMRVQAANRAPGKEARLDALYHYCDLEDTRATFVHSTRVYSPKSSGGGSGGGGGRGGGGGGSSGGGHSF